MINFIESFKQNTLKQPKNHSNEENFSQFEGGGFEYSAPALEVVTVEVEKGFATSGDTEGNVTSDSFEQWGNEGEI